MENASQHLPVPIHSAGSPRAECRIGSEREVGGEVSYVVGWHEGPVHVEDAKDVLSTPGWPWLLMSLFPALPVVCFLGVLVLLPWQLLWQLCSKDDTRIGQAVGRRQQPAIKPIGGVKGSSCYSCEPHWQHVHAGWWWQQWRCHALHVA